MKVVPTDPKHSYNRKYLVTVHHGNRAYVIYHGNDRNTAEIACTVCTRKRYPGQVKEVRKLWIVDQKDIAQ